MGEAHWRKRHIPSKGQTWPLSLVSSQANVGDTVFALREPQATSP